MVDLIGQVPSTIVLVDHALARAFDKGAIGLIEVSGEENLEIFEEIDGAAEPGATAPDEGDEAVGTGESVSILPGSFETQPMDSPDELPSRSPRRTTRSTS